MLAHGVRLPFSLEPLIAEAKRRARQRRLLVASVIVALACGGLGAALALRSSGPRPAARSAAVGRRPVLPASSAPSQVVVDVWGQSARSGEVAGRPLDKTLALFRSTRLTAALPSSSGRMGSLASVAAHMRGEPGRLLPSRTRRVATPAGPLYVVPTTRGWLCLQGERFETCHRGLLRQGTVWNFQSVADGVDVVGIAADDVSGVVLDYGKAKQRASLESNVFFVHRRISFTPAQHVFRVGTLAISYRDGRPQAGVRVG